MRSLSGDHATLQTVSSCPCRTAGSASYPAVQTRIVRSCETVAREAPSGDHATHHTVSSCPRSSRIYVPSTTSQADEALRCAQFLRDGNPAAADTLAG